MKSCIILYSPTEVTSQKHLLCNNLWCTSINVSLIIDAVYLIRWYWNKDKIAHEGWGRIPIDFACHCSSLNYPHLLTKLLTWWLCNIKNYVQQSAVGISLIPQAHRWNQHQTDNSPNKIKSLLMAKILESSKRFIWWFIWLEMYFES